MSHHIPFIYNSSDCELVTQFYSDSRIVRVTADKAAELAGHLPASVKLWVDPQIDGFCQPYDKQAEQWKSHVKNYAHRDRLCDPSFIKKPEKQPVIDFVRTVMKLCEELGAAYITVPQLPYGNDTTRHRLNRDLAVATREWALKRGDHVKLILPIIITNQKQTNRKVARDSRSKNAATCLERSGAIGYWVVDHSLADHEGSKTLRERHAGLIAFHEELNERTNSPQIRIAGPYWGLNLVLWAKGIITHPAVGVGRGYQYLIAGGKPKRPSARVVLQPLRRLVHAQPELRKWLDNALNKLAKDSKEYKDLTTLRNQLTHLSAVREAAKKQVAQSYKEWYDYIAAANQSGRALALYQDLSQAYVLGKSLQSLLPKSEAPARKPAQVAENLMMQCWPCKKYCVSYQHSVESCSPFS